MLAGRIGRRSDRLRVFLVIKNSPGARYFVPLLLCVTAIAWRQIFIQNSTTIAGTDFKIMIE
jgi:hypothetical protein